ncbi:EpsG family protein [Flavobacterium nackdongense]|uniref:EpsG family protein n=1 Tax=Flavobacterium nackdongense TaxID=2547394 RepID=A0A4P6YGU6_9FLAO|nr:EpsG family protein [Flavobacterium nackdongense]QBN19800.1 EpsG family protein [Flavobacterium nackdongense]
MRYNFSIFDLWPYAIISLVFLFCFNNKKGNNSKIIFITLFLFSALRYDIGWDYMSYLEEIQGGINELKLSRFEPLSKAILIFSAITNFYPFTFIVFSFVILIFVKYAIDKYSYNSTISWLVFYSLPLFFFASLSTLRQSAATALILYSFTFAKEKKFIYFIICIILASSFHSSGIIGLFILPLVILKIDKKINILLLISSFLFASITKEFLEDYFYGFSIFERFTEVYVGSEASQTSGSSSLQYLYYLIAVFNLLFYNKLVSFNEMNKLFISISNFGVVVFNLLIFEPISALRISAFFLIFWIFLFPYYGRIFSKKISIVVSSSLVFVLIALSFFYVNMYINSYENRIQEKVSFLPYKFWWDNY